MGNKANLQRKISDLAAVEADLRQRLAGAQAEESGCVEAVAAELARGEAKREVRNLADLRARIDGLRVALGLQGQRLAEARRELADLEHAEAAAELARLEADYTTAVDRCLELLGDHGFKHGLDRLLLLRQQVEALTPRLGDPALNFAGQIAADWSRFDRMTWPLYEALERLLASREQREPKLRISDLRPVQRYGRVRVERVDPAEWRD